MTIASSRPRATLGVLALVLSASLLAIWRLFAFSPALSKMPVPSPPPLSNPTVVPPGMSKTEFYNRDFVPLLKTTRNRNQAAADAAVSRFQEDFERYRGGIPRFVDDVTSWSTRFGVLRRMTQDGWKNFWKNESDPKSDDVKDYMRAKFEAHILSRGDLQKSVNSALDQFRDGVTANRNLLLREMKLALETSDLTLDFPKPDFEAFQREFDDLIAASVAEQASDSVENAVIVFVASSAGTIAAEKLVSLIVQALASYAVVAGTEAAATTGSSMAGGGALGATAGWLGGPAGEVIGVGIGLVIGAIIDWWLTDSFKETLTQELTTYLTNLERQMVDGVPATDGHPDLLGLRRTLSKATDKIRFVQSAAVLKALEKVK